jgi:hypothetical protein
MLDNPYVKAAIVAFLAAVLSSLYSKFNDPEDKRPAARFAQVFVCTLVAGVVLVFATNGAGGDDLMTEPFIAGGLGDF